MHICSKALYPTQGSREWLIKDTGCRTLPLADGLAQLLVDREGRQPPAGYVRICCKTIAVESSVLRPEGTVKYNCLAVNVLHPKQGGIELQATEIATSS